MKVLSIRAFIHKRISARGSKPKFKGYKVRMITSCDPRYAHLAQKMYALGLETQDSNPKMAMDWYRKAISFKPDFFGAMVNLSALLISTFTMKANEEAEEILQRLLEIRPDYVVANFNLALLYQNTRRNDLAEKFYLEALKYDPLYEDAYFNLGDLYASMGRHRKSRECFKKYLELDPFSRYAVQARKEIMRMDAVLSMGKDNYLQIVKRSTD